MNNKFLFVLSLVSAMVGASSNVYADPWNDINNPANMSQTYNYNFDSLPLDAKLEDARMPWSDNYWESDWAGISLRWNTYTPEQLDPNEIAFLDKYSTFDYTPPTQQQIKAMSKEELKKLSPAEKYDILMGRYDFPTVKSERERTSPDMEDWQGICHGWTAASINLSEPQPIEAASADGVVVPFGSADIKGLLAYYYGVTGYDYARGNRLMTRNGNTIEYLDRVDSFDPTGWLPVSPGVTVFSNGWSVDINTLNDGAKCKDPTYAASWGGLEACLKAHQFQGIVNNLNTVSQVGLRPQRVRGSGVVGLDDPNAGAFHIVMANQIALQHEGFIGNINKRIKNQQIWNQPIVGYESVVLRDRRNRNGGSVKIGTTLKYVVEIPQTWEPVVNTPKQRFEEMYFEYTLELDSAGNITGGEWNKRKYHPSFIWKHGKLPIRGYFGKLNDIYHARFKDNR